MGQSVEGLYCKRSIQCLASSEILTPTPPHRPASVYPIEYIFLLEMKQGQCICPLSCSVHCNFTCDGKCSERGWACTPHPYQTWLILHSNDGMSARKRLLLLCVPPAFGAGVGHTRWVERGWGSIVRRTPVTGLYSIYVITLWVKALWNDTEANLTPFETVHVRLYRMTDS